MTREEAIKVVKSNWPDSSYTRLREALETLVPELKESEDERIRKRIKCALIEWNEKCSFPGDVDDMIAWLEKQGEQKPTDIFGPKFMVGDRVIVHNKDAYQVVEVNQHDYRLRHILGGEMPFPFTQESSLRLWTIQDAKDGDVLASSVGAFIYNGRNDGSSCPGSYCGINTLGQFKICDTNHWTGKKVYPATKEQRDILFFKMKEAGYEWEADKKELKKIEQKPVEWSEEDLQMLQDIISGLEATKQLTYAYEPQGKAQMQERIDWLKSLRPQKRWKPSEEQLQSLQYSCNDCRSKKHYDNLMSLYGDLMKL